MLRWLRARRSRPAEPPAAPSHAPFDASIDIGAEAAVDAVRRQVRRLPGAEWISVEAHPGAPIAVRLFAPGTSLALAGAEWTALRQRIEQEIRAAMAPAQAERPAWAPATPLAAGFAETVPRSPFEALEQLAAAAGPAQTAPPPPPTPSPVVPAPVPAPTPAEPPASSSPSLPAGPAVTIAPEDAADVARLSRLLALVLPADPTPAAAAAVHRLGSYAAVLAAPEAELRAIPGLGTHCVAAIKLVHAAAIRFARAGVAAQPMLKDRQRLQDYLAAALARERIEQFRVLFLDAEGMLRADEVQARGTVNHTPVYPREVIRRALALDAAAIVLVHNHPTGDPSPSREDIEMTQMVAEAARVMNVSLRDHLIVGNGRWVSLRDQGLLR